MNNQRLILSAVVAMASFLPQSQASILLTADSYAVLGGTTVTSTGATVLNGDLGVSPGTAITGFPPGTVTGTTHAGDSAAAQAQSDTAAAYNILKGETPSAGNLTGKTLGVDLLTVTPGVYDFSSSAQLTGSFTLDAMGDSNARFVFQIGSTLTTASGSSILLIGGAQAGNVFWQVGSSAALGAATSFNGSILADASITLNNGATMNGRALALGGAVTLDDNVINVPTAVPESGTYLAGLSALGMFAVGWRNRL